MERSDITPPNVTQTEERILDMLTITLYSRIQDPTDKFIVAMVFELGYGREDCARALGVTYQTVYNRINKIKEILRPQYEKEGMLSRV